MNKKIIMDVMAFFFLVSTLVCSFLLYCTFAVSPVLVGGGAARLAAGWHGCFCIVPTKKIKNSAATSLVTKKAPNVADHYRGEY